MKSSFLISIVALMVLIFLFVKSTAFQEYKNKTFVSAREDKNIILTEPEIHADAYIVRFAGENEAILKRREWKRVAPASLTKILTAVLARELLADNTKIKISNEAKELAQKLSGLPENTQLSRDVAIRIALVESANDVAASIAEAIGRDAGASTFEDAMDRFRILANTSTQEIGMHGSYFMNPTGLDADGHTATVFDLAVLAEYVWMYHPSLWAETRAEKGEVRLENGKMYRFQNTNELLSEYPAIRGGKTGLTDDAKEALMFLYPAGEKIAIVVLIRSDDRFGDARRIINWLEAYY